jgi:hypothetical protein
MYLVFPALAVTRSGKLDIEEYNASPKIWTDLVIWQGIFYVEKAMSKYVSKWL